MAYIDIVRSRRTAVLALIALALVVFATPSQAFAVRPGTNGWYWPTGENITSHSGWLEYRPWYPDKVGWHLAIDICRPVGTPVYALTAGTVVESRNDVGGYGPGGGAGGAMVVRYAAADGFVFDALYGHLDGIAFQKGSRVAAGEVLAYMNNYNPAHVHFGIHPGTVYPSAVPEFPNHDYVGIWMGHTHEYTPAPNPITGAPGIPYTYGWADPVQFLNDHAAPPVAADTSPPVTTSDLKATFPGPTSVHLSATDIGSSGVAATYYKLDGGAQQAGIALGVTGVGSHTLEYWSVDRWGNEELPHPTTTFQITGTATPSSPVAVFRFYNPKAGVHFYTASAAERDNVISKLSGVWRYEGVSYNLNYSSPSNTAPLYRFYNIRTGTHFYTASAAERDNVVKTLGSIYRLEGLAYFVSPTSGTGTATVYRFYNMKAGTHFFTASSAERDNVIRTLSSIYRYEGPAFFIGQ